MRDRTQRPELEQPVKPALARAGVTDAKRPLSTKLEVSPGVKELTGDADWSDATARQEVSYEVFLEQLAHDMAYEDKLSPDQQALLHRFGYQAAPSVDGPFGFQMRVFAPTKPDFPHPVIAFRGTEFTSGKDLQADLAPQGVGHNQFRANQRRIQSAIGEVSRFGRIWVTGHSLGGALAQLTAATYSAAIGRVITFQSPSIDAYSVKQLEAYNRQHPNEQISSTHYQVAGDVVSSAGERLTPGEVVQFELKPSDGSTTKTMTAGMLTGLLVGPASGTSAAAAMEAVAKHRAFPVSNAAQEHPAFRELFEEGKTFERIAGISRDTFEARKPISSEAFKNSSTSNFLRFNIGRGVFEAEKAMSDWGNDAKAREWTIRNRDRFQTFTAANLLEQLQALLSGWVSDDDVVAFESICFAVRDPKIMVEIRAAIRPHLEELHSESQRRWIEDAIRYQPKVSADGAVQRDRSLEGGGAEDLSVKPFQLSGGRALETAQRERLEAHAGISLETVRIFEGEEAAEAAAGYNAKAFTQGENIVLGKGVSLTDELARHETEHVKQQRESSLPSGVDPLHSAEDAARTAARDYAQGQNAAAKTPAPLEPAKATGSVQRLEGKPAAQSAITITFSGQSAREETFSAYSRTVLEDILRATGVSSCTITSTTRTPHDQARIFYQQLTGTLAAASYAAAGEAVKAVGRAAIKQKKSRVEVIALMEASIRTYEPMSQVSKHLADPAVLNVFDVAPSSIPAKKRQAFVDAVNADARVNRFLHPGNSNDPAFHIEVPQGGAAATPTTSVTSPVVSAPAAQTGAANAAPTDVKAATPASTAPQNAVQRLGETKATINADYISDLLIARASAFGTGNFGADILSGIRQIETNDKRVLKPNERGLIVESVIIKCASSPERLKSLRTAVQQQKIALSQRTNDILQNGAPMSREQLTFDAFIEQCTVRFAYMNDSDLETVTQDSDQHSRPAALLRHFGYTSHNAVFGRWGLQLRVFTPIPTGQPGHNPKFRDTIVAFRGTEGVQFGTNEGSVDTLVTDFSRAPTGYHQYNQNAELIDLNLMRAARTAPGNKVILSGHSLGGALAQIAAVRHLAQTKEIVTFQSPAISEADVKKAEAYNKANPNAKVQSRHYRVDGDVVPSSGDRMMPGTITNFTRSERAPNNSYYSTGNLADRMSKAHVAYELTTLLENRDPATLNADERAIVGNGALDRQMRNGDGTPTGKDVATGYSGQTSTDKDSRVNVEWARANIAAPIAQNNFAPGAFEANMAYNLLIELLIPKAKAAKQYEPFQKAQTQWLLTLIGTRVPMSTSMKELAAELEIPSFRGAVRSRGSATEFGKSAKEGVLIEDKQAERIRLELKTIWQSWNPR